MALPITIVIPARNSARTIDDCLRSVLEAAPADLREVIVVDNGSTDQTRDAVKRYPVRLEIIPPGFVSRSRNVGARLAKHPIVAFVDSDCAVENGWHSAICAALQNPAVGIVGLRHDAPRNGTWVQRAWDLAHSREPRPGDARDVVYVPAGNMAMRAAVFAAARGFDETLETGEDPDLCARVAATGLRVVEDSRMRCIHFGEPATLAAVFRRERWHGRGTRLRYGDGRLAPIMLTSTTFGATVIACVIAAAAVTLADASRWWLAASVAALLGIPAVYAARYGRSLAHKAALWPLYIAYFLGRASALGVVFKRAWHRRFTARAPGPSGDAPRASSDTAPR
jgi:glycosyltransferase involved in cell wall biosynthesis